MVIATSHGKEKVIAPIFKNELGIESFVLQSFDTDTFGTFSGEVDRTDDPLTTARKKCLLAMNAANCDIGIASEGSFGAHPQLFFVPADDEWLVFIDKKNDLEIVVRELSTDTNFNAKTIQTEDELLAFAELVKFPSHSIILKKSKDDFDGMKKGINNLSDLSSVFHQLHKYTNEVYAETDMRAMHNPSRMKVIEQAAIKLATKINSHCPNCSTPGFGITNVKQGLPCAWCSAETRSTLSHIYSCAKCDFSKEEFYPHKKTFEDPMFCDSCNP